MYYTGVAVFAGKYNHIRENWDVHSDVNISLPDSRWQTAVVIDGPKISWFPIKNKK